MTEAIVTYNWQDLLAEMPKERFKPLNFKRR